MSECLHANKKEAAMFAVSFPFYQHVARLY